MVWVGVSTKTIMWQQSQHRQHFLAFECVVSILANHWGQRRGLLPYARDKRRPMEWFGESDGGSNLVVPT